MIKQFIIILTSVAMLPFNLLAAGSTEQAQSLSDGLHIGGVSTDRIGFWGATPVVRPAATDSPFTALANMGILPNGTADKYIKHATVALTAANINGMYAAPVVLIASQGAGKIIVVHKLVFKMTWTATDFASGGAVIVQYANTANGGGTQALDSTMAATLITHSGGAAAGTAYSVRLGAVLSTVASATLADVGLYISNASGAFTTGTGTAVVEIDYSVI